MHLQVIQVFVNDQFIRRWLIISFLVCWMSFEASSQYHKDSLRKVYPDISDSALTDSLIDLGWSYRHKDLDTLFKITDEAYEFAVRIKYTKAIAAAHNSFGEYYLNNDEYEEAEKQYKAAIEIAEDLHDSTLIGSLSNNLGIVYQRLGKHDLSLQFYFNALRIAEEMDDNSSLGNLHDNIAIVLFYKGDIDKAEEHFKKALALRLKYSGPNEVANSYNNLGILYRNQQKYKEALHSLEKAAEIWKNEDPFNASSVLMNMANVYREIEKDAKALEYYDKSYGIAQNINNRKTMMEVLINKGELFHQRGELKKAKEYFLKGISIAEDIQYMEGLKYGYNLLSDLAVDAGDYQEAYKAYRKYSVIKDSLIDEEKVKAIARLQEEYEADQKDKEIKLLEQEKELSDLRRAQEEKEKIERELQIEKQQYLMYGLAGGGAFFLLLALLFLNRSRIKQRANTMLSKKNIEIQEKKEIIEEKNKDITDSLRYAKNIQKALLSSANDMFDHLPKSFIYYLPRDIVSGDFYWYHRNDKYLYIAAADCTGHGVPGAFVSIMCHNLMSYAAIEKDLREPGEILSEVNANIYKRFLSSGSNNGVKVKDGMDVSLCRFTFNDFKEPAEVAFSGAMNPMVLVRKGEVIELQADRSSVGGVTPDDYKFKTQRISLEKNDQIYIYSDGFQDQFGGGEKYLSRGGKKYMVKRFKRLLADISHLPAKEQEEKLSEEFHSWKADFEQVDDVCVIGIRV